jgi:hypothetical protein
MPHRRLDGFRLDSNARTHAHHAGEMTTRPAPRAGRDRKSLEVSPRA